MTIEKMSDAKLADLLERNGFPSAAMALRSGLYSQAGATAYIAALPIVEDEDEEDDEEFGFYNDDEGRLLRDYVRWLQS